jgi:type IV pilus assembly protein PilV
MAQHLFEGNVMNKSNGFTIVEVLVALIILSVGTLGLGMMQMTSVRTTQGGYMRSQATILAYDIIDSMRANSPGTSNGNYNILLADATPIAVNCYGVAADCSTAQSATSDIVRWRTMLANHLPTGNGQVATADLVTRTGVTVTVSWLDPYSANVGAEQIVLVTEIQ